MDSLGTSQAPLEQPPSVKTPELPNESSPEIAIDDNQVSELTNQLQPSDNQKDSRPEMDNGGDSPATMLTGELRSDEDLQKSFDRPADRLTQISSENQ